MKFIINRGVEADLYTAQGFEALSGARRSVAGGWQIPDADRGAGVDAFMEKDLLWQTRRTLTQTSGSERSAPVRRLDRPLRGIECAATHTHRGKTH